MKVKYLSQFGHFSVISLNDFIDLIPIKPMIIANDYVTAINIGFSFAMEIDELENFRRVLLQKQNIESIKLIKQDVFNQISTNIRNKGSKDLEDAMVDYAENFGSNEYLVILPDNRYAFLNPNDFGIIITGDKYGFASYMDVRFYCFEGNAEEMVNEKFHK